MENLPEKFLERLKRLYPEEVLSNVLQAIQTKPLPSFRTNTIKTTTEELEKSLKKQNFEIEKVSWYQDAFILKNKSVRELTETEEYKKGEIYIQNLSSMIPALVLEPKQNEKVLDLCAAPGSKTTQIASLMQNQGELVANDLSRQRLYKMETILKLYNIPFEKHQHHVIASKATQSQVDGRDRHVANAPRDDNYKSFVLLTNLPGQTVWKKYPEYFDRTLVDVPCSMEGRIRLDDPETYTDWKLGKIKALERMQQFLLRSAISATKVGGTIVYSTCTLAPEENEGVIDWIMKKAASNAVKVEKIDIKKLALQPGMTQWNKGFVSQTALTSRITPTALMEGFFIAKLRKIASTV